MPKKEIAIAKSQLSNKIGLGYLSLVISLGTVVVLGFVLSSNNIFADNSETIEASVTVPVSCSMTGTGMNTHNAEIANGTYVQNIGTTTLHTFCNDNNGFAIYAAGYTGNEIGETNSNKLVGTSATSNLAIDTGLATSAGNPDVSNWAMKLAITQDSGDTTGTNAFTIDSAPNTTGGADASFTQYHVVPNEYTKVAHKNSATDMTTTTGGVKLTTTYAAYVSKTQPADTYTGQVIYTLVHPSDARDPGQKSINDATTLQEVTFCDDTITVGEVYTLVDTRNNQSYKVARLADGNCWMLENLALDPTDSATAANMNAKNTNASAEAINNFLNGGSSTAGWSSTPVENNTSNFYLSTKPMINNASKNTMVTSYGPASSNGQAKVGIYYNFCAASAGTHCYGYGELPTDSVFYGNITQDICPANWRIPTNGDNEDDEDDDSEYKTLFDEYNTTQDATNTASLQYNLSTPLSGNFYNNSVYNQNSYGWYWSSTFDYSVAMYSEVAYPLNVTPTTVLPSDSGRVEIGVEYGLPIRCLAK